MYKPLEIKTIELAGLMSTLKAMRLPKESVGDSQYYCDPRNYILTNFHVILGKNDSKLAGNLIRGGNDHAKCMRGVDVWAEMKFQAGWMMQLMEYRYGADSLSTTSTMHNELINLSGFELGEAKQAGLANKIYTRIEKFNYQSLRGIYRARRRHRMQDWRVFCKWIEGLPYFDKLIYPEFDPDKAVVLYEE